MKEQTQHAYNVSRAKELLRDCIAKYGHKKGIERATFRASNEFNFDSATLKEAGYYNK